MESPFTIAASLRGEHRQRVGETRREIPERHPRSGRRYSSQISVAKPLGGTRPMTPRGPTKKRTQELVQDVARVEPQRALFCKSPELVPVVLMRVRSPRNIPRYPALDGASFCRKAGHRGSARFRPDDSRLLAPLAYVPNADVKCRSIGEQMSMLYRVYGGAIKDQTVDHFQSQYGASGRQRASLR